MDFTSKDNDDQCRAFLHSLMFTFFQLSVETYVSEQEKIFSSFRGSDFENVKEIDLYFSA